MDGGEVVARVAAQNGQLAELLSAVRGGSPRTKVPDGDGEDTGRPGSAQVEARLAAQQGQIEPNVDVTLLLARLDEQTARAEAQGSVLRSVAAPGLTQFGLAVEHCEGQAHSLGQLLLQLQQRQRQHTPTAPPPFGRAAPPPLAKVEPPPLHLTTAGASRAGQHDEKAPMLPRSLLRPRPSLDFQRRLLHAALTFGDERSALVNRSSASRGAGSSGCPTDPPSVAPTPVPLAPGRAAAPAALPAPRPASAPGGPPTHQQLCVALKPLAARAAEQRGSSRLGVVPAGTPIVLEGSWDTSGQDARRARLCGGIFGRSWVSVEDGDGVDLVGQELAICGHHGVWSCSGSAGGRANVQRGSAKNVPAFELQRIGVSAQARQREVHGPGHLAAAHCEEAVKGLQAKHAAAVAELETRLEQAVQSTRQAAEADRATAEQFFAGARLQWLKVVLQKSARAWLTDTFRRWQQSWQASDAQRRISAAHAGAMEAATRATAAAAAEATVTNQASAVAARQLEQQTARLELVVTAAKIQSDELHAAQAERDAALSQLSAATTRLGRMEEERATAAEIQRGLEQAVNARQAELVKLQHEVAMVGSLHSGTQGELDETQALLELSKVALKSESAEGHSFVTAIVKEAARTVHDRIQAAAAAESRARLAEAEAERLRRQTAEAAVAQQLAQAEVAELERALAESRRQVKQLEVVTTDLPGTVSKQIVTATMPVPAASPAGTAASTARGQPETAATGPAAGGAEGNGSLLGPVATDIGSRGRNPEVLLSPPQAAAPPAVRSPATQSAAYKRLQQRQQRRGERGRRAAGTSSGQSPLELRASAARTPGAGWSAPHPTPTPRGRHEHTPTGDRADLGVAARLTEARDRIELRRQRRF
eukprot:SAG22_NODE_112_length_19423_cov_11.462223_8_plen_880_part_00